MKVVAARRRAAELIDSLGLSEVADRTVSTLSGGQRRRLDIAMGLIHAAALLFLDEPSTGLDPQNRANLQEHIVELRKRHDTTIVLTTHYLDEADSMAERVIVIDHGRIIADDTPARLKTKHVGDRIVLGFDHEVDAAAAASGIPHPLYRHGTRLTISVPGAPRLLPDLLEDLRAAGVPATEVEVRRPTLDDVFLKLTGRSFELHLGGALLGLAVLCVFCLGLGALSYTLALAAKNQEWLFWTVQQTLLFPLLLLAGMLLPVLAGPGWLQALSKWNPLTYVVDAERALFAGDVRASTTVTGAVAAAGVGALGLLAGVRAMKRSD
ncbi:ATP-binding cassette domain-containing protein [Actinoplanes sp. NPDC026623]|uniref:ATP-binding cassette domain-containing protein n=1 Tax=Actinoplanes sp. NPDC026623 TaxID=3155610 RepID=UPI00340F33A9